MAATRAPAIPALMYGTAWKQEATTALVVAAVEAGFRAIDTANQPRHYSEALVGAALAQLAAAGIGRDRIFLQTKFTSPPGQDHRIPYDPAAGPAEQVAQSLAASLEHLGTDRLDAYLLHGPSTRSGLAPYDLAVWRAMEDAHRAGTAVRLGVSNVTAAQVVLRFALEEGMLPLTGNTDPERMRQDLEITSFNLLPDEIAAMEAGAS